MKTRAVRILTAIGFLAMLVLVVRLNRSARLADADTGASDEMRYGFRLEEVSRRSGIDFVHTAPTFDNRLAHIMPMVAAMGAAVSVADFNGDGWQDLYVTNSGEGSQNGLYRNNHDGTFADVAGAMGVADVNRPGTGVSMGAVWADFDNDGDEDLFLYKYGPPRLFRNDGDRFADVTAAAGLPAWVNVNSAIWLDYDRDGYVDLFLAGYWPERVNLWHLDTTRVMPESFEYAENGGRKYLLRNNGAGVFQDVTEKVGIASTRWTLAAVAADFAGSGYPDLFLANDYGISQLYVNRGGTGFVDVSRASGIGLAPKSGMNAAIGDVFNTGRFAIYQTNISEPGILIQGNNLWVPEAKDGPLTYENLATSLGVDLGGWSWGAQFGDLNNDGTLDVYLANGYVSGEDHASYWYDFSQIAVGHSRIIGDAANWPPMRGRTLSGYQTKRLWINDGRGRFTDVAQAVGAQDRLDGRAVALADLFNSGSLAVVVANQRGPLLVYANTVKSGRHWIAFELKGTRSNWSAIGARVETYWGGMRQDQQVSGGSGFSAQNQRRLHFGLGAHRDVDRVVIRWPSGRIQTLSAPQVDTVHRVIEPQ